MYQNFRQEWKQVVLAPRCNKKENVYEDTFIEPRKSSLGLAKCFWLVILERKKSHSSEIQKILKQISTTSKMDLQTYKRER